MCGRSMGWLVGAVLAVAVAAAIPASAGAEESRSGLIWMPGTEISDAFSGKALAGIYPSDKIWAEAIHGDGTTDYREGPNNWKGRWWTTAREFCFEYPPPGEGGCFRVVRISVNCFELYDFTSTHGRAEEPPNLADVWNGRMWYADKPTTCEERPNS